MASLLDQTISGTCVFPAFASYSFNRFLHEVSGGVCQWGRLITSLALCSSWASHHTCCLAHTQQHNTACTFSVHLPHYHNSCMFDTIGCSCQRTWLMNSSFFGWLNPLRRKMWQGPQFSRRKSFRNLGTGWPRHCQRQELYRLPNPRAANESTNCVSRLNSAQEAVLKIRNPLHCLCNEWSFLFFLCYQ